MRLVFRKIVACCPDMTVAAEAADGFEALWLAQQNTYDMLVLDVFMPGCNGFEVLKTLRAAGSLVPVVFYSMNSDPQYADSARKNGAQGFLTKDMEPVSLIAGLREILAGGISFPSVTV